MKAFIISLILTIALGITVFFLGWIPLSIPARATAVAFSKTGGYHTEPIRAGRFIWMWENILPTNLTLYLFPDETFQKKILLNGVLPSGLVYGESLGDPAAFDYRVEIDLSFKLNHDELPSLMKEGGFTPENTEAKIDQIILELTDELGAQIRSSQIDRDYLADIAGGSGGYASELSELILLRYPFLTDLLVRVLRFDVPDFELYVETRNVFLAQIEKQQDWEALWQDREWSIEARETFRLRWLERYGELLERYPNLIELFNVGLEDQRISSLFPDFTEFEAELEELESAQN